MPATPEEMKTLVDAYERSHHPMSRAMADLLLRGDQILSEHRLHSSDFRKRLHALIQAELLEHGVSQEQFSATLRAFDRLQSTVEQLDQLPP